MITDEEAAALASVDPEDAPNEPEPEKAPAKPAKAKAKKARKLPKGETPSEVMARVATGPVTYAITLSGRADDGDPDDVVKAFEAAVKLLRKAGLTVHGGLTGHAPAKRDDLGELIPEVVLHQQAGDVE